jgi:hypothetical protein
MAAVASKYRLETIAAVGVAAGLVFAAFETLMSAILMGVPATIMPLRMIAGIVLGPAALDPRSSILLVAVTGTVVHLVLSVFFTAIFAFVTSAIATVTLGELLSTPGSLALGGVIFGLGLWLVNFYVLAPLAGWTWFPERGIAVVQFFSHGFCFGAPMGWMLGRSVGARPASPM